MINSAISVIIDYFNIAWMITVPNKFASPIRAQSISISGFFSIRKARKALRRLNYNDQY